jgi:hypothetical protein
MSTNDVQYLDWQWVEENPETALELMVELHRENARLREQIAALGEIGCLNLDDSTVAKCDAVTGGEKYKDVLRRLFVEQPKELAALRQDKGILDWMNNNIQAIMFKYKPDGFTWDFRKIIGDAMSKEAKP